MNSYDSIVKSIGRLSEEIRYGTKATFVEILMRRAIAPLLSNIYQLEKELKLLDELLSLIESNRSFLILMLLSARFEFFREAIKYVNIQGKLKRVVAPSSYSYKWLPKLFHKHDVRILYPYLNVGVHNTLKIFGSLTNAILIRDNSPLRTTSPFSINRYIFKKGLANAIL